MHAHHFFLPLCDLLYLFGSYGNCSWFTSQLWNQETSTAPEQPGERCLGLISWSCILRGFIIVIVPFLVRHWTMILLTWPTCRSRASWSPHADFVWLSWEAACENVVDLGSSQMGFEPTTLHQCRGRFKHKISALLGYAAAHTNSNRPQSLCSRFSTSGGTGNDTHVPQPRLPVQKMSRPTPPMCRDTIVGSSTVVSVKLCRVT